MKINLTNSPLIRPIFSIYQRQNTLFKNAGNLNYQIQCPIPASMILSTQNILPKNSVPNHFIFCLDKHSNSTSCMYMSNAPLIENDIILLFKNLKALLTCLWIGNLRKLWKFVIYSQYLQIIEIWCQFVIFALPMLCVSPPAMDRITKNFI